MPSIVAPIAVRKDAEPDQGLATVALFCGVGLVVSLGLLIVLGAHFGLALGMIFETMPG